MECSSGSYSRRVDGKNRDSICSAAFFGYAKVFEAYEISIVRQWQNVGRIFL